MSLITINRFKVSSEIVRTTEANLRRAGSGGMELFVLWSGVVSGEDFLIRSAHVPNQTASQLNSGLLVRVDGDALHQLNIWLYEHNEILAVQVHAHPTNAFHSKTDDTFPIVTAEGSVSIVAADFCRLGLFSPSSAIYRLRRKVWRELKTPSDLFQVN